MPRKDLLFGLFGLSYYESDLSIQYQELKKEFSGYKDFLQLLERRWKDQKKEAFFNKNIKNVNEDIEGYLYSCEKLIRYLEEARTYTTED